VTAIEVDLVEHTPGAPRSGIGRYTRELQRHLPDRFAPRLTTQRDPPLTPLATFMHHLPLGVIDRRPGSLVHFVEDLGCSQMLYRPVHPAVATSHDLGFLAWPPEARMHRGFDRLIWRLSFEGLRRMDAVIAVSEYGRDLLIKRLGLRPERVVAIHSGVDSKTFHPIPDARATMLGRHGLPAGRDDRYLLYVGTEIPRKNLGTLLRALRRLPPGVRLLKAGSAGHHRFRRATLVEIAALSLGDRVIILDELDDEDLRLLYAGADTYVCPSFLEGFGQPVVEAMACGAPVVCSNVTALPEVVGDAALQVAPEDEAGFAAAIRSILEDPVAENRLRSAGLARSRLFSWQRTAGAVAAVYDSVLRGRASVA
jgi:glycosyltransferase involved in cell wall biosynthesis